jgi:hypothetical protein
MANQKIYITGTGRCGTTFLIKLFTFLGYNTGYTKKNFQRFIFKNCNSGMERLYHASPYVIKNPNILCDIETIINDKRVSIKTVVIPIRDYKLSASSRQKHGTGPGGLIEGAQNEDEQLAIYNKLMANYVYIMTKYDINTIFIDFDRMVNDKMYLFTKLKSIMDEKNISFDLFSSEYDVVSETSRPK